MADEVARRRSTVHVATVHYRSPRWIETQVEHLRRHVAEPLQIWGSIQGIDPHHARHFDRVIEHVGSVSHPEKLNHLALEISSEADDEDIVMFLDGDAFPIADLGALLAEGLGRAPLVAVRRTEHADEPHPHPCFCVTTVGFWRALPGDWSKGYTWLDADGTPASGVGANLLRALELSATPWVELHRSNGTAPHPALFAVYGGVIYHHGAAFRQGVLLRSDRQHGPANLPVPPVPGLAAAVRRLNRRRRRRWRRATEVANAQISEQMYERIVSRDPSWLGELLEDHAADSPMLDRVG